MPRTRPWTKSAASVRVCIAENSFLNCQLVERALRSQRNRLDVVGSAVKGAETVALVHEKQPDVAVISAQLQDGVLQGYRVLDEIRLACPRTRAVMLLHSRERELVLDAFRCGARGVVFRDQPLGVLGKCIHAVYQGQVWANSETMSHLVEALGRIKPAHIRNAHGGELLSKREAEVVRLVAEGLNNREISLRLVLSEHTVRNYLFHIFDKLGISSRIELVLYWWQQQMSGSPITRTANTASAASAR